MSMKILLQHTHSTTEISGVLTYVNAVAPELGAKGAEVKAISTKESGFTAWLQSIIWADVVHMNSNHFGFALLSRLLGKKIVMKYHYLFFQSTHSHYRPMSLKERLRAEFIRMQPKPQAPLKWKLYTLVKWARLAARFATAALVHEHTACSQFLAESYAFPWPITPLYNPVKIALNSRQKKNEELAEPHTFTFVGRLDRDKGVDILLAAAKHLKDQHYTFQVFIIGDGPEASKLKALADELGLSEQVRFLGYCAQSQVLATVRSSLALVVPSRWQDPAPYVVMEAASMQTCAIVSRMGGLPEVAGPQGLFFENEDAEGLARAMRQCLDNPGEAVERGMQAYHYAVDKFSPTTAVNQLFEIFQDVTQRQPSSSLSNNRQLGQT